jgi:hypothetical protein
MKKKKEKKVTIRVLCLELGGHCGRRVPESWKKTGIGGERWTFWSCCTLTNTYKSNNEAQHTCQTNGALHTHTHAFIHNPTFRLNCVQWMKCNNCHFETQPHISSKNPTGKGTWVASFSSQSHFFRKFWNCPISAKCFALFACLLVFRHTKDDATIGIRVLGHCCDLGERSNSRRRYVGMPVCRTRTHGIWHAHTRSKGHVLTCGRVNKSTAATRISSILQNVEIYTYVISLYPPRIALNIISATTWGLMKDPSTCSDW